MKSKKRRNKTGAQWADCAEV